MNNCAVGQRWLLVQILITVLGRKWCRALIVSDFIIFIGGRLVSLDINNCAVTYCCRSKVVICANFSSFFREELVYSFDSVGFHYLCRMKVGITI